MLLVASITLEILYLLRGTQSLGLGYEGRRKEEGGRRGGGFIQLGNSTELSLPTYTSKLSREWILEVDLVDRRDGRPKWPKAQWHIQLDQERALETS